MADIKGILLNAWMKFINDRYGEEAVAKALAELPDIYRSVFVLRDMQHLDVAETAEQRTALRLIVSRQTMARPYVMPPGVPADRLQALRAAFDATMKDAGFLTDAKRQDLEVRPISGADADALIRELYATPPAIVKLGTRLRCRILRPMRTAYGRITYAPIP